MFIHSNKFRCSVTAPLGVGHITNEEVRTLLSSWLENHIDNLITIKANDMKKN